MNQKDNDKPGYVKCLGLLFFENFNYDYTYLSFK